jgi:hypothetical protein
LRLGEQNQSPKQSISVLRERHFNSLGVYQSLWKADPSEPYVEMGSCEEWQRLSRVFAGRQTIYPGRYSVMTPLEQWRRGYIRTGLRECKGISTGCKFRFRRGR